MCVYECVCMCVCVCVWVCVYVCECVWAAGYVWVCGGDVHEFYQLILTHTGTLSQYQKYEVAQK